MYIVKTDSDIRHRPNNVKKNTTKAKNRTRRYRSEHVVLTRRWRHPGSKRSTGELSASQRKYLLTWSGASTDCDCGRLRTAPRASNSYGGARFYVFRVLIRICHDFNNRKSQNIWRWSAIAIRTPDGERFVARFHELFRNSFCEKEFWNFAIAIFIQFHASKIQLCSDEVSPDQIR